MAVDPFTSSASALRENRRYPRQRTHENAQIVFGPDYLPLTCVIVDTSAWGARVRLEPAFNQLPKIFYLVPEKKMLAYEVMLVWQKAERFGVKIITKHDLRNPGSAELSAVRRSCATDIEP